MVSINTRFFQLAVGSIATLMFLGLLTACSSTGAREDSTDTEVASISSSMLKTIDFQDQQRTYYLYVPSSYRSDDSPMPLVLAFHGGQGRGEWLARNTGFNDLADKEGFIVVYPDAIDRHWNDGLNTPGFDPTIDDVSFVASLIDELEQTINIDRRRIYATGMSNGGFFTLRLACELSDRIAAFAPVAATLPVNITSQCRHENPVSILLIGGTDDTFVPWQGGSMRRGQQILSMRETFEFWKHHNACVSREEVYQLPDSDRTDGTDIESSTYWGCRSSSEVKLLKIRGGGHGWPGGRRPLNPSLVGQTSYDINATEVIWNFFKRHALP